jgi:hypothetical protein
MVTIHHGTVMPYSDLSAGSSTVLEKNANVSTPTGGSQMEKIQPARKPARGCSERAIQVYQPPAEGNALASWLTEMATSSMPTPANR